MREEGVKTERAQRMREDIGAEGQATLQNQLRAPVMLSGGLSQWQHPQQCNPDTC